MDPLGDPLTTCPIQTAWEFTMKPYPSGQFGFIDDPDRQYGNSLVWTQTRTRSDGPEPLLTLLMTSGTHQKWVWTPPDLISTDRTSFACSLLADLRTMNHLKHTSPSSVTTAFNWTIPMMQSRIEISTRKYSHHCHLSMRWYQWS